MAPHVNILIPMAGEGSRFAKELWHQPKPLIDVYGKPMIFRVVQNLTCPDVQAQFIFVMRSEHSAWEQHIQTFVPRAKFCYTNKVLQGAACSCLLAREHINSDTPLLIANSDQWVDWDASGFWEAALNGGRDGLVLCFTAHNDTKWSYAKLDADGAIVDIQEKKPISDLATVGMYHWSRGSDFVRDADAMISSGATVNGEFYVAPVYNEGIRRGDKYGVHMVERMWGLGVPGDLVEYLREKIRKPLVKSTPLSHPMRIIAHRANLHGADKDNENKPERILAALAAGYDVECDVWYAPEYGWKLGHDEPQYPITVAFLQTPGLWVHAKNGGALRLLNKMPKVHHFFHDRDDYTITSHGLIWAYPDKTLLGPRCIAVMYSDDQVALNENAYGVCTDYPEKLRMSMCRAQHERSAIDAIVFDLDGTLVETRDLHKRALNAAILKVAGLSFVISDDEHAARFDGLSTAQKLRMLNIHKGLAPEMNKAIWDAKQLLTDELVRKEVRPDERIVTMFKTLRAMGFPIGVASNCIRSSVDLILKQIGLYDLVDMSLSNDDVEQAKPAPDLYLRAAKSFGTMPDRLLVIEDAPFGWQAALMAGAHLTRVSCPDDVTLEAVLGRVGELNAAKPPITVIVPLAGEHTVVHTAQGGRQALHPCTYDVAGVAALQHALRSLASRRHPRKIVFVVRGNELPDSLLLKCAEYGPCAVVRLDAPSRGAACSAIAAAAHIHPDAPMLIFDGCHVVEWGDNHDIDTLLEARTDAAITVVHSTDSRWAYVDVDAEMNVLQVQEKLPISRLACTGLYLWKTGASFLHDAQASVQKNARMQGRFYIAPVLNELLMRAGTVSTVEVRQMLSLRTPAEIREFERHLFATTCATTLRATYNDMQRRWALVDRRFQADVRSERISAAYQVIASKDMAGSFNEALVGFDRHLLFKPDTNLHFTFLKLGHFNDAGNYPLSDRYVEVFDAAVAAHLPKFSIKFERIIVTDVSILAVGIPSADVNAVRKIVVDTMRPYEIATYGRSPLSSVPDQDICHVTLVRFTQPLTADELQRAKAMHGKELNGPTVKIHRLLVSDATWAMMPDDLAGRPTWEVPLWERNP